MELPRPSRSVPNEAVQEHEQFRTEDESPSPKSTTYNKTAVCTNMARQLFEIKNSSLFLLRGIMSNEQFSLMANAESGGLFGDLMYCADNSMFVQIQHKRNKCLNMNQFFSTTGDLSLLKYLHSYESLKKRFQENHKDFRGCGSFENLKLALFTNARMEEVLYQNENEIIVKQIDLFGTGGKIVTINKTGHISSQLKQQNNDDAICDEFLDKLLICFEQPAESKLDEVIKTEIKKIWLSEDDKVFNALIDGMTKWWDKSNQVLDSNTHIWINALHESKREKLKELAVDFKKETNEALVKKIKSSESKFVFFERSRTGLTTSRFLQCLNDTRYGLDKTVIVNLKELEEETDKILSIWESTWCDTLVVECDTDVSSLEKLPCLGRKLEQVALMESKKIVLISNEGNGLVTELTKWLSTRKYIDEFEWEHLTTQHQEVLQSKSLNFQGITVSLGDIIKGKDQLASKIDGDTVELLLKGKLQLGQTVEKPISQYIHRSLLNSEGKTVDVKVLNDIDDKMVLVTGQPGLGKTSLLTDLGRATKIKDPLLWIVRLNLNTCSSHLKELNFNQITDGISFLQHFSFHAKTRFEKCLFHYCLNNDKMVMLLDGFDEISPSYDEKMLKILKGLPKEKIHKLWVTSRAVTKTNIENTLKIKEFKLKPLTRRDQKKFLVEYWSNIYNTENDLPYIEQFADFLLKRTYTTFENEDLLTGEPLLLRMMAEIYQGDLEKYKHNPEILPDTLDLLTLFDSFIEQKIKIFFEERMKIDTSNAANENYFQSFFNTFFNNHMLASLQFLLHPDDYKNLPLQNTETLERDLEMFWNEIRTGIEKTGIIDGIDSDNRIRFIHPTFCEYFVAKFVYKNFYLLKSFVKKITFDKSYKVVNDILHRMQSKESALHVLVLNRDMNGIKEFLKTNPTLVDKRDSAGRTALNFVASIWDSKHRLTYDKIAQILLNYGASIKATDDVFDFTPLQFADKNQAWNLIGMILQKGGNTSDMVVTSNYMNKIVYVELIKFLQSVERNDLINVMKQSAKHGDTEVMRYLIEEHDGIAKWNEVDDATLMHFAAEGGNINTIIYLNTLGLSWTCKDKFNNIPLHYAARAGRRHVVDYLIKNGSDVNEVNSSYETPLLIAASSLDADHELIKCLIVNGADINVCTNDGASSLSLLAKNGKLKSIECLVRQGIYVDRFVQTAIECAKTNQHNDVVIYLQNVTKKEYVGITQ